MKKTKSNTLALLRANGVDGIKEAEDILKTAGCKIQGTNIIIPDEGIKSNRENNSAFEYLTQDWDYKTCEVETSMES